MGQRGAPDPVTAMAQEAFTAALAHHAGGRLQQAETLYRQVLLLKPGLADAHNNLGNLLRQRGNLGGAVASYREALRRQPEYPEALSNLGLALHEQGKLAEAIETHRKAIRLAPGDAVAHDNLGLALQAQGRLAEAAACHRTAIRLAPGRPGAHSNLGLALHDQGNLREAAACYRKAIALDAKFADAYYNLHAALLDEDNLGAATENMKQAVALAPGRANFRFFLGVLLDCAGDVRAAEQLRAAEAGGELYRAGTDAWRYFKGASRAFPPRLTGSRARTFALGFDAAPREGLVLEFGVGFGASIRQIAALAGGEVHGFDSFQGLPEAWHEEPAGSYSTGGVQPEVPANVRLHAGWFEQTLPAFLEGNPGPVRFANVDCDLYSSTRTVLRLLRPRLVPGTVLVFDEFIGNQRWREDEFRAFQEAAAENGWKYEYICLSFFTKQAAVRLNG